LGTDGSDDADRALTVAMELAERLSAGALIVRAWSILTAPHPLGWEFGNLASVAELSAVVRARLIEDAGSIGMGSPV
jgi:hypothetical protein